MFQGLFAEDIYATFDVVRLSIRVFVAGSSPEAYPSAAVCAADAEPAAS